MNGNAQETKKKRGTELALCYDIYKEIGEILGAEAMLEIYYMFKGQQITFPVRLYSPERIRDKIFDEYNGKNIKELAKKYSYSEKTVGRMLEKAKKK